MHNLYHPHVASSLPTHCHIYLVGEKKNKKIKNDCLICVNTFERNAIKTASFFHNLPRDL